jgi:DnaJ-class molecular chaperone
MSEPVTPNNAEGVGTRTSEAPFAAADGYAAKDLTCWMCNGRKKIVWVHNEALTPAVRERNCPNCKGKGVSSVRHASKALPHGGAERRSNANQD